MYNGFMTLYALELGVSVAQVGLITSLGLAMSIFFSLISAFITDKLGRRYTTLIFDSIGWTAAQLIWAFALNIRFFVIAAIINAFGRVVMNSWHCLMLEDSEPGVRVHIFNFLLVANILGGFFAPVGSLLISRMTLVPAMRIMLLFSAFSMTTLFIVRHLLVKETAIGRQKIQEMKGVGTMSILASYIPVLKRMVRDKPLVIALLLRSLNFIQFTVRNTFLAVLVTERMGFRAEIMAVFYTLNAVVTLIALLFITPFLSRFTIRLPIFAGILIHIAATAALLLSPSAPNLPVLIFIAMCIALGTSVAAPRIDTLAANSVSNEDRAAFNAVMSVIMLLLSTPFGFIGGILSGIDPRLPFLLTLSVFLISLLLLRVSVKLEHNKIDVVKEVSG